MKALARGGTAATAVLSSHSPVTHHFSMQAAQKLWPQVSTRSGTNSSQMQQFSSVASDPLENLGERVLAVWVRRVGPAAARTGLAPVPASAARTGAAGPASGADPPARLRGAAGTCVQTVSQSRPCPRRRFDRRATVDGDEEGRCRGGCEGLEWQSLRRRLH